MPPDELDERELEPLGWDAIDRALAPLYGEREPKHYGTILPMMLGGKDPLQGISVYKNLLPEPHYHFVTYGFSELYEKESDDPEFSGFGFELTFRLACEADASEEPPFWPLNFLQNLARYVFQSGNAFDERHHTTLNGPIALDQPTEITAILFQLDPQLQQIETPNGLVKFLQIVGLCGDEYTLIQQGYFAPVSRRVAALAPLSITDILRPSILRDPTVLAALTEEEPDDTQREVFGTIAEWSDTSGRLELRLAATIVPQLKGMLRGLATHGEPIAVYGRGTGIVFELASQFGWQEEEGLLRLSLTKDIATASADELQPRRGTYQVPAANNVRINVAPVDIKDGEGKVVRTHG